MTKGAQRVFHRTPADSVVWKSSVKNAFQQEKEKFQTLGAFLVLGSPVDHQPGRVESTSSLMKFELEPWMEHTLGNLGLAAALGIRAQPGFKQLLMNRRPWSRQTLELGNRVTGGTCHEAKVASEAWFGRRWSV